MAKAGMKRPSVKQNGGKKLHLNKNDEPPVPEIQGKAKHGHKKAGPF